MGISSKASRVLRTFPIVVLTVVFTSGVLLFLSRLKTENRLSLSLTLHLSEDHYIQEVLHTIDIPVENPEPVIDDETAYRNLHYGRGEAGVDDQISHREKHDSRHESKDGQAPHRKLRGSRRKETMVMHPDVAILGKGAKPATVRAYKQYLKNLDILSLRLPNTLPHYKSPCWHQRLGPASNCKYAPSGSLRGDVIGTTCLPYFFVVGQPSCGVPELLQQLKRHPDVALPDSVPQWIERRRFFPECSSLSTYTQYFRSASRSANNLPRNASTITSHSIIGDGSDEVMSDNHLWRKLSGNRKCNEPCYTNADYVGHLNNNARILVVLCDPVQRLYREYKYRSLILNDTMDRWDFHKLVIEAVYRFKQCRQKHSQRYCVYESEYEHPLTSRIRTRVGMYSTHIADWLRVFPRDRIHVTRLEDHTVRPRSAIGRIFDFLSIDKISSSDWKKILGKPNHKQRLQQMADIGEMLNITRNILSEFYHPHNNDLVYLLKDAKYYWKHS